jgi:outer membrane protein
VKRTVLLIFFLIWQASATPVTAEPVLQARAVERKIDLPTLVGLVEKQNLDIALTNSRINQARANYLGSYANLMPSVRAQQYVEKFTGGDIFIQAKPVSVDRITYRPRVMLDYQLPLGGKPLFQIQASKLRLEKAKADHKQNQQAALLEAVAEYYAWLRDIANKTVAEQLLKEADLHVQINEAKLNRGYGTRLEVEQAKVEQAERKNALIDAKNEEINAATTLASYLNLPLDDLLVPTDATLAPTLFWTKGETTMIALYKMAEENRPDVQGLAHQIKALKAQYHAAFSDLFPTVGVTSYYGGVGPKDNLRETFQRGVYLSVDLLRNMGVATLGSIQLSKAQIQESMILREHKLNEIRQSLAKAYHDWQKYQNKLEVTQQKVAAAQEAYRISKARKTKGFGIELEVLKAQSDLSTASQELQDTIYHYNTSQLRLLYETGQLTPISILSTIADAESTPVSSASQETKPAEATQLQ